MLTKQSAVGPVLTAHRGVLLCGPCILYIPLCGDHRSLHGHYTDRGYSWESPTGLVGSLSTGALLLLGGTGNGLSLGHTDGSGNPRGGSHRLKEREGRGFSVSFLNIILSFFSFFYLKFRHSIRNLTNQIIFLVQHFMNGTFYCYSFLNELLRLLIIYFVNIIYKNNTKKRRKDLANLLGFYLFPSMPQCHS